MAQHTPTNDEERRMFNFASSMKRIPRRAIHCEIYGTISIVLDERHAQNIFRKVAPSASSASIYAACRILQDRLDDRLTS